MVEISLEKTSYILDKDVTIKIFLEEKKKNFIINVGIELENKDITIKVKILKKATVNSLFLGSFLPLINFFRLVNNNLTGNNLTVKVENVIGTQIFFQIKEKPRTKEVKEENIPKG